MCSVKPPKVPDKTAPAAPPPPSDMGASFSQGTPLSSVLDKARSKNKFRIDMKADELKQLAESKLTKGTK